MSEAAQGSSTGTPIFCPNCAKKLGEEMATYAWFTRGIDIKLPNTSVGIIVCPRCGSTLGIHMKVDYVTRDT